MLLPRAKSSPYLTLLLSALLALPSNLPTMEREEAGPDRDSFVSRSFECGPGLCLHRTDRKTSNRLTDWSVVADEPEPLVGRDEVRFAPLAIPHRPIDLPSLVPTGSVSRPILAIDPVTHTSYTPPMRC